MISENIKCLRLENNLTQKELAEKLNVSLKTISHWESGYTEPSIIYIKKLKDFFNVTYEELLDWVLISNDTNILFYKQN